MSRKAAQWAAPAFLEPYAGRWVAVTQSRVLAHGESANQVRAKLRHLRCTAEAVFQVPTYSKWGN